MLSRKRSREEIQAVEHPTHLRITRCRVSMEDEIPEISSASTVASFEGSGLASTDPSELDSDDSLSSSSEEPSSESDSGSEEEDSEGESDSEETITTLRPRRTKPKMHKPTNDAATLQERLKAFLPQFAAANEALEKERLDGKLEDRILDSEDGEGLHIEMDLGLGVLEEREPHKLSDSSSDSSDSDEDMPDTAQDSAMTRAEKDIMGRLLGQKRIGATQGIKEVE